MNIGIRFRAYPNILLFIKEQKNLISQTLGCCRPIALAVGVSNNCMSWNNKLHPIKISTTHCIHVGCMSWNCIIIFPFKCANCCISSNAWVEMQSSLRMPPALPCFYTDAWVEIATLLCTVICTPSCILHGCMSWNSSGTSAGSFASCVAFCADAWVEIVCPRTNKKIPEKCIKKEKRGIYYVQGLWQKQYL